MKSKTSKQRLLNIRKTFFRALAVLAAGLFIFSAGKEILVGAESPALKVKPDNVYRSYMLLPEGVKAVWDLNKAYREITPTRERICINGLWQWQPGEVEDSRIPDSNWGYFKVPGNWPGIRHHYQKESQNVYVHPNWKDKPLDDLMSAWYRREIAVPENWANRRSRCP